MLRQSASLILFSFVFFYSGRAYKVFYPIWEFFFFLGIKSLLCVLEYRDLVEIEITIEIIEFISIKFICSEQ